MRVRSNILVGFGLILVNALSLPARAQLGFDLKIDKPKPYEERVLRSEKPQAKPLRAQGRFFQNLTTHYNYFFNANTKLNEVIDAAKQSHKDDYTLLLPFYNYTLDATAQNSNELDSVIYKARTGIVMHDLRNDWADNLYLLWGAAWFMEKKFDSAALMFQFINYAFAEKEKDGYYRYIGSRIDGGNALTISTKEKSKNIVTPPSRNNAFIWQARTMIESGRMAEAGSLIATLKNDPLFPERLHEDLEEVQAYWFYKQGMWDSSATHLLNALDQAKTKQEKARWEYLAAQMLEKAGKTDEAQKWYSKSIGHTTDPVMDVYAPLNIESIKKHTTANYIDRNIEELLKMARRDKYTDYRDVIYYMAAQMELERNNFDGAQKLLLKSAKYNNNNIAARSKSYLQIADLTYNQKKYVQAAPFYDSIQSRDLEQREADRVLERQTLLKKVVGFDQTIRRQDSLQRIASMPEDERTAYINQLVKQLRKQQGLDDVAPISGGSNTNNTASDLFGAQPKGEWYFYNTTLKTQGNQKFKQNWGNRPNVDNWRRFSDVSQQLNPNVLNPVKGANRTAEDNQQPDDTPDFATLLGKLPLTDAQVAASNDSIRYALFETSKIYLNEIEDFESAISILEQIRTRFSQGDINHEEILFNLYYAYRKAGNQAKAEEIKALLISRYPDSRFATILRTGKDPEAQNNRAEVTKTYEDIYDLFIEGQFEKALAAKKVADSTYQTKFWQPQLLYIESVYHIRQRNDSVAKQVLQTLIAQSEDEKMASKAQTMIDVLNRRHEIEAELMAMQVVRPQEDVIREPEDLPRPSITVKKDSSINSTRPVVTDNRVNNLPPDKPVTVTNTHQPVKDTTRTIPADTIAIKPVKKDTVAVQPVPKKDTLLVVKPPVNQPKMHASGYIIDSMNKHYAVVILDKVDALFVNEVRNAFYRYGRDKYYTLPLEYEVKDFDADRKLLLVGSFSNAREAAEYMNNARLASPSEIMPWLKAEKYSFTITTAANLETLLQKKDLPQYLQFLDQTLRVK